MSSKEVEHQTGDIGIECNLGDGPCVFSMSLKEVEHQTGDTGIECNLGNGPCVVNVYKRGRHRN